MIPSNTIPKRTRCSRQLWRSIIAAGAVIAVLGAFGPVADAAKPADTSAAAQAAKDKGPKKQGPFVQISGTVTNALTGQGVGGVSVTFAATSVSFGAVTDANGDYAEKLPLLAGGYEVSFAATNYKTLTLSAQSFPKGKVTLDAAIDPVAPVIVSARVTGDAFPGVVVTAMGTWTIMDGSSFVSSEWTQSEGAAVAIDQPGAATTDVALPSVGDFKAELVHLLKEPPVGADELPPNVEVPPGEFVGGLQDRFQVVAINPFALERAGEAALHFAVTTTSGTYSAAVAVHTELEWRVNPGIRNVPIDIPVLLYGKEQASWDWMFTSVQPGSMSIMMDSDTQTPEFVPDVPGMYTVQELVSGVTMVIHAGTWRGIIVGQDANGRPVTEGLCFDCHDDSFAPDKFASWKETGHAEIFTNNLNTSDHYGESCFGCHTVGYDPRAENDGVDEAVDWDDFLNSDLLPTISPDNWTRMLAEFPASAQKANIQCENCHGPQNGAGNDEGGGKFTTAHGGGVFLPDEARVSLSAEVCGSCHGEPLRHARFQQWQLSRHSNYEVAIAEGTDPTCARCHTVNGFLTWLPVLTGEVPGDPLDDITISWTADEVHPQTCPTCHDPHAIGTTSGDNTNAKVRISGDTPLLVAGFQAFGVGKGAMCMTCHNTRRGLRNDSNWATTTDRDRAPHGGVQADLIMGQNAYFVTTGIRGEHSFISDTCVNCHMKKTPPPDVLSYNQGGTNHTFFASKEVCIECHTGGEPNAAGIQAAVGGPLHQLEGMIGDYYVDLMGSLLAAGNQIDLNGDATVTDASQIVAVHLSETRGRQALVVELVSGEVGPARLTDIDIIVGPDAGSTLFDHTDEYVLKATWNYLLVHTDRSGGVHNPAFSSLVLQNAIAQF